MSEAESVYLVRKAQALALLAELKNLVETSPTNVGFQTVVHLYHVNDVLSEVILKYKSLLEQSKTHK